MRTGLRKVFVAVSGAILLVLSMGSLAPVPAGYVVERHRVYRTHYSVRSVQRALREAGYRVAVDGRMGPQTRAALRAFQEDYGLRPTGRVNRETLTKLGL